MTRYASRPHQTGVRSITLAAIANDLAYEHGTPPRCGLRRSGARRTRPHRLHPRDRRPHHRPHPQEDPMTEQTPAPADVQSYWAHKQPARLYSRGTPVRNVRLDDDRWNAITERAAATGGTASDVMRDALDAYLDRRP